MPDIFRFWTHGISVQAEFEDRVRVMQRASWGARVRQRGGSDNFFHLAIPSPVKLDNEFVDIQEVYFRGSINTSAMIDRVVVSMIKGSGSSPERLVDGNVSITGRVLDETFNVVKAWSLGPVVLTLRVRFSNDDGEMIFEGAGARFDER